MYTVRFIMHCKIKKDNHQVPKIIGVPENKTNSKKRKKERTYSNECEYELRLLLTIAFTVCFFCLLPFKMVFFALILYYTILYTRFFALFDAFNSLSPSSSRVR